VQWILRPRHHGIWETVFTGQKTNQQYQSAEGKSTKEKSDNTNNEIRNNRQKRIQIYSTTSPLVYTNTGD